MKKKEKVTAIVLAGGSGRRMRSEIPKQYLSVAGHPVLYYSLQAFEDCHAVSEVILVTGKNEVDYCLEHVVRPWNLKKVSCVTEGGKERYDSVYAGLKAAAGADCVLIHDGARPLVTNRLIMDCVEEARISGACVAAVPSKDTIKVADGQQFACRTPDRSTLWIVQTPQAFSYALIREAYDRMHCMEEAGGAAWEQMKITDDAMVAETFLHTRVKLIPGDYANIKITTPEDLILVEALLQARCRDEKRSMQKK